jgi:hypothetical protein
MDMDTVTDMDADADAVVNTDTDIKLAHFCLESIRRYSRLDKRHHIIDPFPTAL